MAELVIDASLVIKFLIKNEIYRSEALHLIREAHTYKRKLLGPPILNYEVESYIQKRLYTKRSTVQVADHYIRTFYKQIQVVILDHPQPVQRTRRIARKYNQERIYDSMYAALAEIRMCELWTADEAFYNSVKAGLPFVKFLANYPE